MQNYGKYLVRNHNLALNGSKHLPTEIFFFLSENII
jgi:hypothetical protein